MSREVQVTFDAHDPRTLSTFWRDVLGYVHPAPPGVEHRRHRLIDRDLARGEDEFTQPQIDRSEFGGRVAHPERQDRPFDVETLGEQHLGLAIERQMPSVFGNQHGGDHCLGRQPTLD